MRDVPFRIIVAGRYPELADLPEVRLLATRADHATAFAAIDEHHPDVAVIDLDLPGGGVELVQAIGSRGIPTRSLIVAEDECARDLHRALAAGATGFVPASTRPRDLVAAIRAVSDGALCFSPRLDHALSDEITGQLAQRT